ncbi:hypothetical protein P5G62_009625 [Neobacillus sp. 179-C4.2 HS]|uniref:DUF5683 domain-containing protein n=1 Tax=Neobacillus driksii TaxID=3035913 RepID=A0ABV4YR87_9BACI|nr:hypothetical protein [Neobacillus sp. 179.-C4.2 HS]MDP5194943.1 hypothetical protein [Neobacillus sp. 179.-C4.2 HS]
MTIYNVKKSPLVALLWSFALPGFGQFYNGQYILGFTLMIWEIIINLQSGLNLTVYHTFRFEPLEAHNVIDYSWGLFYPSVMGYSIWQAYNKSRLINTINNNEVIKDYRLTGFCYGLVAGMNFGIYSHQPITNYTFFDYPVYSGLLMGLLGGIIGHLLEKLISKLKKQK